MTWLVWTFVVAAAAVIVTTYNRAANLRQACDQAWSDISVQTLQRYDVVPNFVEVVRGYARHERDTLEAVILARNVALNARDGPNWQTSESNLTAAVHRVVGLAEAYPDLKANNNFLGLQAELSEIENKIAAARRFFNRSVAEYNAFLDQFPTLLFSRLVGFRPREFFDIDPSDRDAVARPPAIRF